MDNHLGSRNFKHLLRAGRRDDNNFALPEKIRGNGKLESLLIKRTSYEWSHTLKGCQNALRR